MMCKCPVCNKKGERFGSMEYTVNDESFKCLYCGFKGKLPEYVIKLVKGLGSDDDEQN